eukprot:2962766-Pleurochrysis_carterae.AAC.1
MEHELEQISAGAYSMLMDFPLSSRLSNACANATCSSKTKDVTAGILPSRSPRDARPTRRKYSAPSRGKSKRMTWSVPGRSMPRERRSVATRMRGGGARSV